MKGTEAIVECIAQLERDECPPWSMFVNLRDYDAQSFRSVIGETPWGRALVRIPLASMPLARMKYRLVWLVTKSLLHRSRMLMVAINNEVTFW